MKPTMLILGALALIAVVPRSAGALAINAAIILTAAANAAFNLSRLRRHLFVDDSSMATRLLSEYGHDCRHAMCSAMISPRHICASFIWCLLQRSTMRS